VGFIVFFLLVRCEKIPKINLEFNI
jgi:hypothetical protein